MPTAAKIASSSVGGSRLTRRVPYFVFQSSLIGASHLNAEIPRCPHVALQYEFRMAIQPCTYNFSSLVASYSSMVVAASASACSDRTKSREAGTAKCASRAARSAHCSKNTSRSGFSQSAWTAWEMQPGLGARATDMLEAQFADFVKAVGACRHAAGHHDHVALPFLSQRSWRGIAGGGQIQRLLRPAFP